MREVLGLALWIVLVGGAVAWREWSLRYLSRQVSRNAGSARWEQDVPYPECFDEQDREDDF
jgi:hypothetical protein